MEQTIESRIAKARKNLNQANEYLNGKVDSENKVQIAELKANVAAIEDPVEKQRSEETLRKIQEIREQLQ